MASAPGMPPRADEAVPRRGRSRMRAIVALGAGVIVVAIVAVVLITQLGGGKSTKTAATGAGRTPGAAATPATHAARPGSAGGSFSRGSTTVAVLNGTTVHGLALQVAGQLVHDGFARGTVTNASDQQRSATIISYLPGHRRNAEEVARALKVAAVQPIDTTTKAVACPPPGACTATVVVTVGSDRSQ